MFTDPALIVGCIFLIGFVIFSLGFWLSGFILDKYYLREVPGWVFLRIGWGGIKFCRNGCWYHPQPHAIYRVPIHPIFLEIFVDGVCTKDGKRFSGRALAFLHIPNQDDDIWAAAMALSTSDSPEVTSDSIRRMLGPQLEVSIRIAACASTGDQMLQNNWSLALKPHVVQELRRCGIVLDRLIWQSLQVMSSELDENDIDDPVGS